ncbi:MAG: hypothetical protein JW932_16715 [Deltaproteobacteria bacterium]|nr:hypothetical protein [Deltaproteobacteria bacterium]
MNHHSIQRWCRCLIFGLLFFSFHTVAAQDRARAVFNEGSSDAVVIGSNRLEIDNKQHIITFTGDVDARLETSTMQCQKMLVYFYYQKDLNPQDSKKREPNIDRIIATDNVIILLTDGQATAEKVVYYQKDEKVVLSGNATLKRGAEILEGPVITISLKEDHVTVGGPESSGLGDALSAQDEKGGTVGP